MSDSAKNDVSDAPDYTGHEEKPSGDSLTRLRRMALRMMTIADEISKLEAQTKVLTDEFKNLEGTLVPNLMHEIGLDEIKIANGFKIALSKKIRCSLSQVPENKARWMDYLIRTGNDGLVKKEFVISYTRDRKADAEAFAEHLKEVGVHETAAVTQKDEIHSSTLLAFLRREKNEHPEVLEVFGAFEQKFAEIKTK